MLQELNIALHGMNDYWMHKLGAQTEKAVRHVQFCCGLYRFQLNQGRHVLQEHPWSVRSWNLQYIDQLLNDDCVMEVHCHMCRFGMTSHID